MCVIATADKGAMPTVTQLAQMSEANPDGAGIAWQTGQADLTDGTQGKFAKIDQNGRIEWLYGAETIQGSTGRIKVSNTIWDGYGYGYEDGLMGYDPNDIWDEAYQTGYEDGQEELLNGAVPDWTPHARH
ncbi:hypothetical protein [Bifidobacterium adolescentis]|uniref:hypothetical protein n=1 Tax=Bifidobacterium adolescentis TaxID=1680 RepID=UPI003BB6A1ED